MYRLFFLLVSVIVSFLPVLGGKVNLEEIRELDELIDRKGEFDRIKYARIDSLKQLLRDSSLVEAAHPRLYAQIGDEYMLFMADSSMAYYTRAIDGYASLGDSTRALQLRFRRIRPEMICGFYAEAHNEFNHLSMLNIPDSLLGDYYECGYRLYSFALNSMDSLSYYYMTYYGLADEFRRKWIASLPMQSVLGRLYSAEQSYCDGNLTAAKLLAGELISELSPSRNEYAIAAAIVAGIMQAEGRHEEAMRYYAMSAVSDILCSVKENQSLYELSMLLYDAGDIERAYHYIFVSIEDAAFCNAQVRVYNASSMLPVIEASHREELNRHDKLMESYVVVTSLLLVGLFITVLLLIRQMKRLSVARKKLHDANMTKDEYMGQFLKLCSVYMSRLDSFARTVNRKLVSGQVDELLRMTRSGKFNEEQHRDFYQEFDDAFLKIYTTFVDEVNNLLRPEERITLDDPHTLTTELRIYALMRLGIEDNAKIAEFLKYSVNTIYTYRNKMKNKAIDRASFEAAVMKIGKIE